MDRVNAKEFRLPSPRWATNPIEKRGHWSHQPIKAQKVGNKVDLGLGVEKQLKGKGLRKKIAAEKDQTQNSKMKVQANVLGLKRMGKLDFWEDDEIAAQKRRKNVNSADRIIEELQKRRWKKINVPSFREEKKSSTITTK